METLPAICFCFYFEEDGRSLFPSAPSFFGMELISSIWVLVWSRASVLGVVAQRDRVRGLV